MELVVRKSVLKTDGEIFGHEAYGNELAKPFDAVLFTNHEFDEAVEDRSEPEDSGIEVIYNVNQWREMGAPLEITVEIRPGNTLGSACDVDTHTVSIDK